MKMKIELTLDEVKEVINNGTFTTSKDEIVIKKFVNGIDITISMVRGDEIDISAHYNYDECEDVDIEANGFEYDELKEMLTKRLLK